MSSMEAEISKMVFFHKEDGVFIIDGDVRIEYDNKSNPRAEMAARWSDDWSPTGFSLMAKHSDSDINGVIPFLRSWSSSQG